MNEKLAKLIHDNRIVISCMARDLKCSRNTIYRVLKGKPCSGEFMLKVAAYFNRDVSDIFSAQSVLHVERNTA